MDSALNIAVVDDESSALEIFSLMFRDEVNSGEFSLKTFSDPVEFLDFLHFNGNNKSINILLSDINMPQMDGFQVLKNVKESFPHIPVFMETAYDHSDFVNKAYELGADDYITKPIDYEKLKEKLRALKP